MNKIYKFFGIDESVAVPTKDSNTAPPEFSEDEADAFQRKEIINKGEKGASDKSMPVHL